MEKITLHITGMACGGCAANISSALRALDGVQTAEVSHTTGVAEISFDPARLGPDQMKSAVKAAGYDVN